MRSRFISCEFCCSGVQWKMLFTMYKKCSVRCVTCMGHTPQQDTPRDVGVDCGFFTLAFAMEISLGRTQRPCLGFMWLDLLHGVPDSLVVYFSLNGLLFSVLNCLPHDWDRFFLGYSLISLVSIVAYDGYHWFVGLSGDCPTPMTWGHWCLLR